MSIFRVAKTRDYTVMSNHHLKNRALSLKAKGLLSLVLSLPDDWDYSLKGLVSISVEGIDAIRQAVAELEEQGYVVRERVRDEKGCLRGTEYVIYEQPHLQNTSPEQPETLIREPQIQDNPTLENPTLDNPTLDNPTQGKPTQDEPTLENPTQLSTNSHESNTNPINNRREANPYPINPYPSYLPRETEDDGMGWDRDGLAAAAYRDEVRNQIEYNVVSQDAYIDRARLDGIVELMVETLCARSENMTIAGNDYPTELVQDRFRQIRSKHIQYIFTCLNKSTSRVRNIRKYLLTALFNAPSTIDGYYAAKINHDFGVFDPDDFACYTAQDEQEE